MRVWSRRRGKGIFKSWKLEAGRKRARSWKLEARREKELEAGRGSKC